MIYHNSIAHIVYALMILALFGAPIRASIASDELPSMELLEFLGEWQTEEGDWIDPTRFLDINETDLDSEQLKKTSTDDNVKEERSDD